MPQPRRRLTSPVEDDHVTHCKRLKQLVVAKRRTVSRHGSGDMRSARRRVRVIGRPGLAGPQDAVAEVGERLPGAGAGPSDPGLVAVGEEPGQQHDQADRQGDRRDPDRQHLENPEQTRSRSPGVGSTATYARCRRHRAAGARPPRAPAAPPRGAAGADARAATDSSSIEERSSSASTSTSASAS